jgi:hypothetical protein
MVLTSQVRRRIAAVLAFVFLIFLLGAVDAQQLLPDHADRAAPPAASAFSPASIRRAVTALMQQPVIEPPQDNAAYGDWSDVRRLTPGTAIFVKTAALPDGPREIVATDDRVLVVLNLEGVEILREASGLRIGSVDRRALTAAAQGNIGIDQDQNVRLEPAGVFVAGRKVMELEQLLVTILKADVREITRQDVSSGGTAAVAGGVLGFFGGGALGFLVGGLIGANVDKNSDSAFLTGAGIGMLAGGIAGAIFGATKAAGPVVATEVLVYRAAI